MDYRQQSVSGQSWRRARQVVIENPRDSVPTIAFVEEDVVGFTGGEVRSSPGTAVRGAFDPLAGSIPLVNPQTGVALGTSVSHTDLYVILHSLYLHLAGIRDQQSPTP